MIIWNWFRIIKTSQGTNPLLWCIGHYYIFMNNIVLITFIKIIKYLLIIKIFMNLKQVVNIDLNLNHSKNIYSII